MRKRLLSPPPNPQTQVIDILSRTKGSQTALSPPIPLTPTRACRYHDTLPASQQAATRRLAVYPGAAFVVAVAEMRAAGGKKVVPYFPSCFYLSTPSPPFLPLIPPTTLPRPPPFLTSLTARTLAAPAMMVRRWSGPLRGQSCTPRATAPSVRWTACVHLSPRTPKRLGQQPRPTRAGRRRQGTAGRRHMQ